MSAVAAPGEQIAGRLAVSTGAGATFVAGSTVVGLGSSSSDLDVYLVYDSRTGDDAGDRGDRRQLMSNGVRIDVQCLDAAALTAVVDRVLGAAGPTDRDVALAVRLCTGAVVTDSGLLADLKGRLTAAGSTLRRLVVNGWAVATYTAMEDLAGLAGVDDDVAVLSARRALLCAGKALAAGCGDLYHGEKWVWRQLDRSAPDGFPANGFRRLLRQDPLSGGRSLDQLAAMAQSCLAVAMTLGWYDGPLDRWPLPSGGAGAAGGPSLRRARYFLPQRYGDGMSLVGPGTRVYPVRPEVALVWGLCEDVPAGAVVAAATAFRTAKPFAGLTEQRTRLILDKLREADLVTESTEVNAR